MEELEGPPVNGTVEDSMCHRRWLQLAVVLGFNELAKLAKDLEEKDYFRLMRDDSIEELKRIGGNGGQSPLAECEYVLELQVPDVMPRLRYREQDIELMRLVVAKHDIEKAKGK